MPLFDVEIVNRRGDDRPAENVHVLVEPAAAGRIAFGGVLSQ